MFSANLSQALLKLIEENNQTQAKAANDSHLSTRQIHNLLNNNPDAKLSSLEKLCLAYDATPNDLLLPLNAGNGEAKQVSHLAIISENQYKALCPHCNKPLECEYTVYCEHCSGKLSWSEYSRADIIEHYEATKDYKGM